MLRRLMAAPDSEPAPIELEVCHRCLVRLPTSAGGLDLPRRIREALASRGLSERTRVLASGCLGYCPQGLVSVAVSVPLGEVCFLFIDPERDGEDLAAQVVELESRAGGR